MTTALILLPFGGALVVWLLPWSRHWAGSFGLLVALAEVGLWIETLVRFDFSHHGVQLEDRARWFGDLGISYHVGLYGFSLWLIGMSVVVMAGSLLMLAAVIVLGVQQGTFDLVNSGTSGSTWIFLGFVAAFAVKAPLFPFHGWLPDAYREAPPEVSAVLSGVVSKAAVYGLLRIAITKFPEPAQDLQEPILVVAAIGLVYGSVVAFRAPDVRGVVAYSSLAQMGLIVLGLFAANRLGIDGAILQSVNHGLLSAT